MKTRMMLGLTLVGLVLGTAATAGKAPERVVQGNTVTSASDPAVRITVPKSAQYVGADRWDLYDVADCEIHVFVEADAQKIIQRLYWIQFEAYLPTNTHSYKYPFTEKLTHGGLKFDVRARFGPTTEPPKPNSDLEHVLALITKSGYTAPPEMMNVRLVNMVDEANRKELMIIYAEDLAPTGATFAELSAESGKARWAYIQPYLIKRTLVKIGL
jgi:hypothetical protein